MSDAVATFAVSDVDLTRKYHVRRGTLTIGAGDYVSGGITLDLSAATNPNFRPYGKFTRTPDFVRVINPPKLFHLRIIPGTALTNWKVFVSETGTGNTAPFDELAVTALPGSLTGDTGILVEFGTQKGH